MNKGLLWLVLAVLVVGVGVYLYVGKGSVPAVPASQYQDNAANNEITPPADNTATTSVPAATSTAPVVQQKTWDVTIKNGAFSPKTLNIKKGDTVRWTNMDTEPAWPASGVHPTHNVYPQHTGACKVIGGSDFDACHGLNSGESWSFQFNYVGSWGYHNHLNASQFGKINVTE